ncbi:MAG TPA: glycoside hydrolase family 15 protein, partial [Mycobacteriales bacterium]|nr:glycoside hydrolase family 15 protein [Mycobacteriales bacterium]
MRSTMWQAGRRRGLLVPAWGLAAAATIVPSPGSALAAPPPAPPPSVTPAPGAPGAPGARSDWVPGDKDGFGTARGTASKVWYTLHRGLLSEIYYPRIDTPSTRATQLVVTDGRTFTDRESDDTTHRVRLRDPRSLTYEQVNRARSGKYLITKTYTADPARSTVLVDIEFRSLTRRPYQLYVLHDPALTMTGDDDTGWTAGGMLVATDRTTGSAVAASGGFTATSSGYAGASDGWRDLATDHRMDWSHAARRPGNVVQLGRTKLTGVGSAQRLTLAVGFGTTARAASAAAGASLAARFAPVQKAYARGWHTYLAGLKPVPKPARRWATEYDVSRMVLAASEDKTYRGGFVAAPGRPWAWANSLQQFPVYHAVWSRDLYEIATALVAMGDRPGADRALSYLFRVQQKPDGSYPQNSRLSGQPVFGGLQMDEVSFPTVLAWHLGRIGPRDWRHIRRAEDYVVAHGPRTQQERWENLGGYSPATIAAEIAGLVVGAEIARVNGATAVANRYLVTADTWRRNLGRWTVTTNGPYGASPYFLRITDGNANAGTPIQIADGGRRVDQRVILDPSFLEVVRLGVIRPDDARVRTT